MKCVKWVCYYFVLQEHQQIGATLCLAVHQQTVKNSHCPEVTKVGGLRNREVCPRSNIRLMAQLGREPRSLESQSRALPIGAKMPP